MESAIGICGKDFAIIAADRYNVQSIFKLSDKEDKIFEIDSDKLLAVVGEGADVDAFGEYVQKNCHLNRLRAHGRPMTTKATANFAQMELALALRRAPFMCNCLLAGIDPLTHRAEMYWLDYLGTMARSNRCAQGYAAHLLLGLLDREYKPDISLSEGLEVMRKCFEELSRRFVLTQQKFKVKIVTQEGVRVEDVEVSA